MAGNHARSSGVPLAGEVIAPVLFDDVQGRLPVPSKSRKSGGLCGGFPTCVPPPPPPSPSSYFLPPPIQLLWWALHLTEVMWP